MTAATTAPVDRARPGALAAFKAGHDFWHRKWAKHERRCLTCLRGLYCRIAARYATLADDSGKRWRLAEERAAGGGR